MGVDDTVPPQISQVVTLAPCSMQVGAGFCAVVVFGCRQPGSGVWYPHCRQIVPGTLGTQISFATPQPPTVAQRCVPSPFVTQVCVNALIGSVWRCDAPAAPPQWIQSLVRLPATSQVAAWVICPSFQAGKLGDNAATVDRVSGVTPQSRPQVRVSMFPLVQVAGAV